jgi:hypothetical protein
MTSFFHVVAYMNLRPFLSLGFSLYDLNGIPRSIFSLDRTKNESLEIMSTIP